MIEGSLRGNIFITYTVADVAKENSKKAAKKMTEAEADAIKILPKTTEAAEAPMLTETREGALKNREGMLKTVAEVYKRLEMVSEKLKLMEYEAGTINRIIQGVVEMVAATMEEELCKMTSAEADVLKMLSTMAEAAEVPVMTDTR